MIRITNLNKTFHLKSGDVTALDNVSLEINDGDIYGVIGYSGAGKSTLVRCINLLEQPDSGFIEVNGTKIYDSASGFSLKDKELNNVRKGIGMIFQQFNLLDRCTVFDNVAYPLRRSGLSKALIRDRVFELLELVDLKEKVNVYPSQLSGGQEQRVAIARALANNPKVLLSDEATSALDPDATESILNLLNELNRKLNLTIVLITHEMAVIRSICNRVAVVENGKVVEEGDTYDIFASPKASATRKFISSTSALGKLDSLVEKDPSINSENGKLVVLTFSKDSVGDALISNISRRFDVNVNIVLANIDLLQEGALGKLACFIQGDADKVEKAIAFLEENKVNVEVKEYA